MEGTALKKEKLKTNNDVDDTSAEVDGGACCIEELLL